MLLCWNLLLSPWVLYLSLALCEEVCLCVVVFLWLLIYYKGSFLRMLYLFQNMLCLVNIGFSVLNPCVLKDVKYVNRRIGSYNKKSRCFERDFVELGGVEPPSKQVTKMLSTCLFFDCFSSRPRTKTPKANLSF